MAEERCIARLGSGERCSRKPVQGSNYCSAHFPARAVRHATKKAAKKKKK